MAVINTLIIEYEGGNDFEYFDFYINFYRKRSTFDDPAFQRRAPS
jgi:hypothetical protein